MKFTRIIPLAIAACLFITSKGFANTYNVTNTGDNAGINPAVGAGTATLRQAIIDANANPGADVINFNIAGAGTKTITLSSNLPPITGQVLMDGYSMPGSSQGTIANRTIRIVIQSPMGVYYPLDIRASNTVIRGLCFIFLDPDASGISCSVTSVVTGVHIWGCYFNSTADGNSTAGSGYAFAIYGTINQAGNTKSCLSNWIIGTNGDGVNDANEGNLFSHPDPTINTNSLSEPIRLFWLDNFIIAGNTFGLKKDGLTPIQTYVTNVPRNFGISTQGCTGLRIGTDGNGTSDALERNVFAGMRNCPIVFRDERTPGRNLVAGNYFGTGIDGITSNIQYANGNAAIALDPSSGNTIGTNSTNPTTIAAMRNVFGRNLSTHILIQSRAPKKPARDNIIANNYIGVLADGVTAARGGVNGISMVPLLTDFTSSEISIYNNLIANNIIANVDRHGIFINLETNGGQNYANKITKNSMYNNGFLGINLVPGTSANTNAVDPNDGIVGPLTTTNVNPNQGMDYGVITGSTLVGNTLTVRGFIGNRDGANSAFTGATVEVFIASKTTTTNKIAGVIAGDGNPTIHGEGKVYLGSITAGTNGAFAGTIDVTGKGLALTDNLVTTATDAVGNTSEFSANTYPINGNIFNDVNGLNDNLVNGANINPSSGNLAIALIDNVANKVTATALVTAGGTYSIPFVNSYSTNYKFILYNTYASVNPGGSPPPPSLPNGWRNTGEQVGTPGGDGAIDGNLFLPKFSTDLTNANFGIVQCPNNLAITAASNKPLVCASSPALSLTSTPTGGITPLQYLWTGNGLSANNTQNTTASPSAAGTYAVTVTDGVGCQGASSVNVGYDNTVPNIASVCNASAFQLTETNGISWLWTTSSGGRFYPDNTYSNANDSDISHLSSPYILKSGNYAVSITDAQGCTSTANITVTTSSCATVLAEGLTGFNAVRNGNNVTIQWQLADAGGYYIIERSTDGITFLPVATVNGTVGINKHRDDINLLGCTTLYYRIKHFSATGLLSLSNIQKVVCIDGQNEAYKLTAYPNPVTINGNITLSYSLPVNVSNAQVIITNIVGNTVYTQKLATTGTQVTPGTQSVNITVLPAGSYMLRIVSDNWLSKTLHIIKQ